MNKRIVKKVLSDPLRYTIPMVRRAAAMRGLWWARGDYLDYWVGVSDLRRGRGALRFRRLSRSRANGAHDWAHQTNDIPF